MAKTPTLYLLLDTRGRFKAETLATSSSAAVEAFRASRKDKRIPNGWTIKCQPRVVRPPEPAPPSVELDKLPRGPHIPPKNPEPPARPFRVGDRVRFLAKHWAVSDDHIIPPGMVLRLVKDAGDNPPAFRTEPFYSLKGDYRENGMMFTPSNYGPDEVELAEPAPTEPGSPIQPFRAAHGFVTGDRVEALPGVLSMSYPQGFKGVVDGFERGKVLVKVADPSPAPNTVHVHAAPGHLRLLEPASAAEPHAGSITGALMEETRENGQLRARIEELEGQLRDMGENLAAITKDRDALARDVLRFREAEQADRRHIQGLEEKLEDIRATMRVGRLSERYGLAGEEWTLGALVDKIVGM